MLDIIKKIKDFPRGNSVYDGHYAGAKQYLSGQPDSDLMSKAIRANYEHKSTERRSLILYHMSTAMAFVTGSVALENLLISYSGASIKSIIHNSSYYYSIFLLAGGAAMLALQIGWAHLYILSSARTDAANKLLKERGMNLLDDVLGVKQ